MSSDLQGKVLTILNTQSRLNTAISGPDWRTIGALHYDLDYSMACIDELAAEFVPCALGWKWWAKTFKKDLENAKLELVDILHFMASEEMVRAGHASDKSQEEAASRIVSALHEAESGYAFYERISNDLKTDSTITDLAAGRDRLAMLTMKQSVKTLLSSLSNHTGELSWRSYFVLCFMVGSSFEDQFRLYLGKSVLNRFRTENGYKTGTYQKMWTLPNLEDTPLEDNKVLTLWLDSDPPDVSEEAIHSFLTRTYATRVQV